MDELENGLPEPAACIHSTVIIGHPNNHSIYWSYQIVIDGFFVAD